MKKYIIIEADTNDGDYIREKNLVNEQEIEAIKKVAKAIKNFKPYTTSNKWTHNNNFPIGDCHRRDLEQESAKDYYVGRGLVSEVDFTMFEDNIPYGEYGIHTITNIDLLIVQEEENLL